MDDIYYLDYKDQQIKKFDIDNIDYKLLKFSSNITNYRLSFTPTLYTACIG